MKPNAFDCICDNYETLATREGGRVLKTCAFITTDLDDEPFGSAFDPVLSGVAQGLARLFPPVEVDRPTTADRNVSWQDESAGEAGDSPLDA